VSAVSFIAPRLDDTEQRLEWKIAGMLNAIGGKVKYLSAAAPVLVPVNTTLPAITGTAQVGFTLSGATGTWTNSPTGYAYQWYSNGVAIGGATASTFLLTVIQIGAVITVQVTASNASGNSIPATSAATGVVLPQVPVNTVLPVITGTAQSGATLSGSNGTWTNSPTGYTYRWLANAVAIVGATANTFTLTDTQIGTVITFEVTASNAGGSGAPATSVATGVVLGASFQVTTTGPTQVLTISALTVSSSMTVDWGDGNQNAYTGSGARTHTYATAGTYTVQFLAPLLVTVFNISDAKVTLNSAQIASLLNVTDFRASSLKAGTFNSSDVSAWRPTAFYLYSMPSGYAITITAGGFSAWTTVTAFNMSSDALTQAQVNQILTDCYTAFATRTVVGGTLTLNGTGNAAPSGIFAALCPPFNGTVGKILAYELLNDSCGVNPTHTWSTVTTN
jgi:hypothetical protein